MKSSLTGRLTAWILAWLLVVPALAAEPQLAAATSFAADAQVARARKIPILVLYSRPGCRWCELARNDYLIPLSQDPAFAGRVLIRQVHIDDTPTALVDFDGSSTSHGAFARARRISLAPTLDFLDDSGKPLVEAIVGMRLPDYYGATIERAIEQSLAKLRGETK